MSHSHFSRFCFFRASVVPLLDGTPYHCRALMRSPPVHSGLLPSVVNPNRTSDRRCVLLSSFSVFPGYFILIPASCLPLCPSVARYAFDKGDCQSARRQNEIALDSDDRFEVNLSSRWTGRLKAGWLTGCPIPACCNAPNADRLSAFSLRRKSVFLIYVNKYVIKHVFNAPFESSFPERFYFCTVLIENIGVKLR